MPDPVVLATNPIHPDGEAVLAGHAEIVVAPDTSDETLRRLARQAAGIIVRAKLPDDIVDHAPDLKALVRHGVGLDFIPVEAATARGVAVANLPGSNTNAVAEFAIAALLSLRRPHARFDAKLRSEGWDAARHEALATREVGSDVLGIVGVGAIGSRIAAIAHHGFGMRVIGASRRTGHLPAEVEERQVDDVFAEADAVVLSCALTDATRGLVNERRLRLMKHDAVLINVARGAVVDRDALIEALQQGRIAGAALDVFDRQPLPPDDALLRCPNLLLSPHVAAITSTSMRAMSIGAAEEMLRILQGQPPRHLVNPEYRRN